MSKLSDNIKAQLQNIDGLISELPPHAELNNLSVLELEGTGGILFAYYNGIENILKQILLSVKEDLPEDDSWHSLILNLAVEEDIISDECQNDLAPYLAFRNFFRHGYTLSMDPLQLSPLVQNHVSVYSSFKNEINNFTEP